MTMAQLGATVIGPAASLADGLTLAADRSLDAAVLDLKLDGGCAYPIADTLSAAAVPHLFLAGYDGHALPPAYRATRLLEKSLAMANVVAMVERPCGDRT